MNKPVKPTKYYWQNREKIFYFDYISNKVSLSHFLEWCKKEVPKGAEDVSLKLEEEWYYDDFSADLILCWKEKVVNKQYKKELEKYNKKLARYKKQCQK